MASIDISNDTLMSELMPLMDSISGVERARLILWGESLYFDGNYWTMKISDFCKLSSGDLSPLGVEDMERITASAYFAYLGFKGFVDDFCKVAKSLTPPSTTKENAASSQCLQMSTAEGMLIFARNYFGCRSFDEAGELPLSDYILARKHEYNKSVFERAMLAHK